MAGSDGPGACFWDTCQEEIKAYSTYYSTQTTDNQTKLSNLIACDNYNSIVQKECETDNGIDTFTDAAVTKFYKCRDSCLNQHKSLQTCRDEQEYCSACSSNPTCVTFSSNAAYSAAYSDAQCTGTGESNCPSSLQTIAQNSCKAAAKQACKDAYIKANASADDPCLPCFSSMISPLIFLLAMLSALYF